MLNTRWLRLSLLFFLSQFPLYLLPPQLNLKQDILPTKPLAAGGAGEDLLPQPCLTATGAEPLLRQLAATSSFLQVPCRFLQSAAAFVEGPPMRTKRTGSRPLSPLTCAMVTPSLYSWRPAGAEQNWAQN